MISKLVLLGQTIRHLKLRQVAYQMKYRLVKPPRQLRPPEKIPFHPLVFTEEPPVTRTWYGKGRFSFLNLEEDFGDDIDWNYQSHGKLWNYNLQYANFLLQEEGSDLEKEQVINDLYTWLADGRLPLEPYPVSLRTINMIRWLSSRLVTNRDKLAGAVYAELEYLSQRLEYHLLGNHLLENGFALIMGGGFFAKGEWLTVGERILRKELEEQILSDGAHFELSPMYHQIIFFRLLELIDWYSNWEGKRPDFENFIRKKASLMRSWLENISFKQGDIPHFNDSSDHIAYSTRWLCSYAERLNIAAARVPLGSSGYRSVSLGNYECKVDVAQIGPDYQSGHGHADTLSFWMYVNGSAVFVEQGTSTYQIGATRTQERSTAAHNTVVVDKRNQSNVWGGFRVAERARTKLLVDEKYRICAEHDGYRKLGVIHRRTFTFAQKSVTIKDEVAGGKSYTKEFNLHIYPGIDVNMTGPQKVILSNGISVHFSPNLDIQIHEYQMADGFNRYRTGKKIVVLFSSVLETSILTES